MLVGKGLTAKEKVKRDAEVVKLRASGMSWPTIAARVGISDRHCRTVWTQWRDEGKLDLQKLDPLDVVFEHIERYDSMVERLANLADGADSDASKVGALRTMVATLQAQTELLMAVGLMPRNLGRLQVELEVRFVIQALMAWAEKFAPKDRLEQAEAELLQIFRREVPAVRKVPALPPASNGS